jgi:hypothetical protein
MVDTGGQSHLAGRGPNIVLGRETLVDSPSRAGFALGVVGGGLRDARLWYSEACAVSPSQLVPAKLSKVLNAPVTNTSGDRGVSVLYASSG